MTSILDLSCELKPLYTGYLLSQVNPGLLTGPVDNVLMRAGLTMKTEWILSMELHFDTTS